MAKVSRDLPRADVRWFKLATAYHAMLRRVIIVSQMQAGRMLGSPFAAVISVTGHGKEQPALGHRWHAIFRIAFDDVDPLTFPDTNPDLHPITPDQATKIASFVSELPSSVQTLVIHRESGISRSSGIAKAVAERCRLRFPVGYKEYNRHVCELVLRQL